MGHLDVLKAAIANRDSDYLAHVDSRELTKITEFYVLERELDFVEYLVRFGVKPTQKMMNDARGTILWFLKDHTDLVPNVIPPKPRSPWRPRRNARREDRRDARREDVDQSVGSFR